MTYLEKVMQVIKFETELLTEAEVKRLRGFIWIAIREGSCPGNYFDGAPTTDSPREVCSFPCGRSCEECWNSEAK